MDKTHAAHDAHIGPSPPAKSHGQFQGDDCKKQPEASRLEVLHLASTEKAPGHRGSAECAFWGHRYHSGTKICGGILKAFGKIGRVGVHC